MESIDGGFVLKNLNLKYLKTSSDKYENEYVYYSISNETFKDAIIEFKNNEKLPYFLGKNNKYVLKIKGRYVTNKQKINGTATVKMTFYTYNEYSGYYIEEITFNKK